MPRKVSNRLAQNWVLCRNLTRPTILAGFILISERDPAAVVAVEMWEPALCAGFQAPGVRVGNSRLGAATDPPARHFHSEAEDSAHFRQEQS
jgi:hypothetical protein